MVDIVTLVSIFMLVVAAFVVLRVRINDNREQPPVGDFPSYPPYAY